MLNFWQQQNKPIFCLAPMEEVTDVAFREMFAKYGKPGVMFTEFLNVDGLLHPEGYKKLSIDLEYSEAQRPIVAQIWGTDPEKFYRAAQLIAKLGFDGVDINMGCPQDKEIGIGACAALMRSPKLAQEIILATKKGAGDLPVSVKTRLGYTKAEEMEAWVTNLLETNVLSALTLHARTKQEKSKVPAQWEKIKEAVEIRNKKQQAIGKDERTLIIGNGDIRSYQEGLDRVVETGCDGVMVGRGAFGSPWFFRFGGENPEKGFPLPTSPAATASPFQSFAGREVNSAASNLTYSPIVRERLLIMLEHARLFDEKLGNVKSFVIMRKHFKAYASGFDGAHELRAKLMETKNLHEVEEIVKEYLNTI